MRTMVGERLLRGRKMLGSNEGERCADASSRLIKMRGASKVSDDKWVRNALYHRDSVLDRCG